MNFLQTDLPALLVYSGTDLKKYPESAFATSLDWTKVPRFLEGTWPLKVPDFHMLGDDLVADRAWYRKLTKDPFVVFDVETVQVAPKKWSGEIFQVGLYGSSAGAAIWDRNAFPEFKDSFTAMWRRLVETKTVVAHNAAFDVARMYENFGVHLWEYKDLDDTIVMHHVLWAEMPHNLEFLSSIYGDFEKLKHLGVGNYDYLVGDIANTSAFYLALGAELQKDEESGFVYQGLKKILRRTIRFMEHGYPVNKEFVKECLDWMPDYIQHAQNIADAYAGFPVKLKSSNQLRAILVDIEDIFGVSKKLIGSTVKQRLTEGGDVSLDGETITALRNSWEAVDFDEEWSPEFIDKRLEQGAHPFLEAKAMHEKIRVLMTNYVKPVLVPLKEENGKFYHDKESLHVGEGSPRVFEGSFIAPF